MCPGIYVSRSAAYCLGVWPKELGVWLSQAISCATIYQQAAEPHHGLRFVDFILNRHSGEGKEELRFETTACATMGKHVSRPTRNFIKVQKLKIMKVLNPKHLAVFSTGGKSLSSDHPPIQLVSAKHHPEVSSNVSTQGIPPPIAACFTVRTRLRCPPPQLTVQ